MEDTSVIQFNRKFVAALQRNLKNMHSEEGIPIDKDLEELGLDSLSAVNLLLDLEETFGISFPDSMLTKETFRTTTTLQNVALLLVSTSVSE